MGTNGFISWFWLYPQHKHGKKVGKSSKTKPSCRATLVYILGMVVSVALLQATLHSNQSIAFKTNIKSWPLKWPLDNLETIATVSKH